MAETLDSKIQKLFKIVQDKKVKLAKLERPSYKTNCSFKYNEESKPLNLHVQSIESLMQILGYLIQSKNSFELALKELNNIEVEQQRLIYLKDPLDYDFKTLQECKIKDGSILYLKLRLFIKKEN